jgi:hexosaminidase
MAHYDGHIQLEEGTWEFGLWSSNGSLLYIEDELIVDNDGKHEKREVRGGMFTAPKTGMYKIHAEWFHNGGPASFYASVGGGPDDIPYA